MTLTIAKTIWNLLNSPIKKLFYHPNVRAYLASKLLNYVDAEKIIQNIHLKKITVWGDPSKLNVDATAQMVNTLFNTASGRIVIGEYTFAGHNVAILTGTHNYNSFLLKRQQDVPRDGNDIKIGRGVWLGSNSTILGPSTIEDHAVVAAGAVVAPGSYIEKFTIYGGIPARLIGKITCNE